MKKLQKIVGSLDCLKKKKKKEKKKKRRMLRVNRERFDKTLVVFGSRLIQIVEDWITLELLKTVAFLEGKC